jgi:hypothetical protein
MAGSRKLTEDRRQKLNPSLAPVEDHRVITFWQYFDFGYEIEVSNESGFFLATGWIRCQNPEIESREWHAYTREQRPRKNS